MTRPHEPVRVVVADDDPHFRNLLRFLLGTDNRFMVVGEAATGFEALDVAATADVVVLDIRMPGLDGLTAIEELRLLAPRTAVIVYSAYDQTYLEAEARCRGAAAFVSKTAGIQTLTDTIATLAAQTATGLAPTAAR